MNTEVTLMNKCCGKYHKREVVQELIQGWREKQKNGGNC